MVEHGFDRYVKWPLMANHSFEHHGKPLLTGFINHGQALINSMVK
jgi:hypothetical protein